MPVKLDRTSRIQIASCVSIFNVNIGSISGGAGGATGWPPWGTGLSRGCTGQRSAGKCVANSSKRSPRSCCADQRWCSSTSGRTSVRTVYCHRLWTWPTSFPHSSLISVIILLALSPNRYIYQSNIVVTKASFGRYHLSICNILRKSSENTFGKNWNKDKLYDESIDSSTII